MDQETRVPSGNRMLEGVDEDAALARIGERGGIAMQRLGMTPRQWLMDNGMSGEAADDALMLISFLDNSALVGEVAPPSPDSIGEADRVRLRPVAETLAMLDGNAFFGTTVPGRDGRDREWYEGYLGDAAALVERNGGWNGWPGQASFARLGTPPESAPDGAGNAAPNGGSNAVGEAHPS